MLCVLAFFFFFDSIAQRLFKQVRKDVPGRLTVESFSPTFRGFKARKIKWSLGTEAPAFEADEVRINVGFGELYSGDYYEAVENVSVVDPRLRVVVDSAGNINLRNLIPKTDPNSPFEPTKIRGAMEFANGRILYRDQRDAGFIYQLSDVTGGLRFKDGKFLDFEVSSRPELTEEVASGSSEGKNGKLDISGHIALTKPSYQADIDFADISLDPFAGYPGFGPGLTLVEGLVDGSLRVTGEARSWSDALAHVFMLGEVKLAKGAFRQPRMPAALQDLAGTITFLGGKVSTKNFKGKFSDIPFLVSGSGEIGDDAATEAHLQVSKFPIGKLNALLTEPIPVGGFAEVDVRVKGTKDDYLATGHLVGEDLQVQDQTIARAETDFLKARDLIHLSGLRATTEAGTVSGEGWVFLGDKPRVLFEIQGKGANPNVLVKDFAQNADFDLKVLGDPKAPLAYGEGRLSGLGSWSQGLQSAAGQFIFSGKDLLLLNGEASKGGSVLQLPIGALDLKARTFSGVLRTLGFDAADVPGLQGISGRFSGSAMVQADLSGETPMVEAQARLDSGDFTAGGLSVSGASGNMLYDGDQLLLSGAEGQFEGSKVQVSGTYDRRNDGVQLVLKGHQMNLSRLGLAGESADLTASVQGILGGTVGLYGLAESQAGKAAVSAYQTSNGMLHGVAWLDGEHDGVQVAGTVVASGTQDDLNLDYNGKVSGDKLAQLGPVNLFGSALLNGKTLSVRPTIMAAKDAPTDEKFYPLTTYRGAAYSFFGPLMAGPLEKVIVEESPFPKVRSLMVAGNADLGTGKLNMGFQLKAAGLEELPMPAMASQLPFEILSGFGNLRGSVLGTLAEPVVKARFLFPWLMLGDAQDRRLTMGTRGRVEMSKEELKVSGMTVSQVSMDSRLSDRQANEGADGLLKVKGSIKRNNQFDVRVKTDGFDPSFFAFFLPDISRSWFPSGRIATNNLHLWGTPLEPNISGEVKLLEGGIMLAGSPYPIKSASVDFSSQNGEIRVPSLGLSAPGLEVDGNVLRARDGTLSGSIIAHQVDLNRLRRFGGLFEGLSGQAELSLILGGTFPYEPQAELGVRTSSLSWNPKVLGGRDQEVAIEKLVLGRFDGDKLEKGLTVSTGPNGTFAELPKDGFEFVRASGGLSIRASGAVSLPTDSFTAFKTFSQWADYLASPVGPDFGRQGEPFRLAIDHLTTSEGALLLGRDTKGVELSTSLALSLEGQWWRDHKKDSGSSLPHYNLTFKDLEVQSGEPGKRSGLRLDDSAELDYQREGKAGYLSLKNWQFGFFRDQGPADGQQVTDPEDLILRQGVVDAEGRLAITSLPGVKPVSEFNLGGADIPLANLAFLLPNGFPLSGLVDSLEIGLRGVLPAPDLSISTLVTGLNVGTAEDMKLEGTVAGKLVDNAYRIVLGQKENEAVALTFGKKSPENHSVKFDGEMSLLWKDDPHPNPDRLDFFAKNITVDPASPLKLSAEIVDKNLEVLASILPGPETTSGNFHGSLLASGTLGRPEFEGSAKLENGRIDSKELGSFSDLQLDADVHRITAEEATPSAVLADASSGFLTRLQVGKLEGKVGNKPFFGGGKAEFAGISPTFLDLFFTGESLPIKMQKLFTGTLDIDLELVGSKVVRDGIATLQPSLQGLLIIPNGTFTVPLGSSDNLDSAAKAPPLPFDVNLDLSLGKEFFVKALSSQIRAVGELNVIAKDGETGIYGTTSLSRGSIKIPFYDASFQVRQGLAIFDGPLIPRLEDVEAVTDLGGYRITARANGRYPDTFKLDLYSDPPLPQAELNRVALLGGLPSQLTGNTSSDPNQTSSSLGSLSNTGVSFLSGILTNRLTDKIGKLLFLSELSFDYIPPATYAVKLAKALDPNDRFLLTVTRIIRDSGLNENLFGMEWRFTRTLLMRIAFDQFSQLRFWLQSINRF